MIRLTLSAVLLAALTAGPAAAPAFAAGSDPAPAVQQDPDFAQGVAKAKAGDYAGAVASLGAALAKDPKNADTLNYLGYSTRKLGQFDKAKGYYDRALAIDPDHRGAHEYLGELFLQTGNLAGAEAHLKKLDSLCLFGCSEYTELKNQIAAYKAKTKG